MKREIKFRGKRIDNGEWIYGFYYQGRELSYILTKKPPHEKESSGLQPFKPYPVIPESVGQFTDLLDNNGKEIYEGDILIAGILFNEPDCHDVYFQNGEFRVRWTMFGLSEVFEHSHNGEIEVIGNIYQNPELL